MAGGQHPALSPAGVGAASQLPHIPSQLLPPSATLQGLQDTPCDVPMGPQVGDRAAQSEGFTLKPPEQRPSPAGPHCNDPTTTIVSPPPSTAWTRSHQTTSDKATKSLRDNSGALGLGGDRLAAQGDVLGVHGDTPVSPHLSLRARHRVSSHCRHRFLPYLSGNAEHHREKLFNTSLMK